MGDASVLVVGETPSLGRSIHDLLESGGVPSRFEYDIGYGSPLSELHREFPIVVAACNEHFCDSARRWARGEIPGVSLIVVGARDPYLAKIPGIRVVPLPLVPGPFLTLVNRLRQAAELPPRAIASRS